MNKKNKLYAYTSKKKVDLEKVEKRYEVTKRLIPDSAHRVLDLGCGTGIDTVFLEQSGYESHGVDRDQGMIKIAKVRSGMMHTKPNYIIAM